MTWHFCWTWYQSLARISQRGGGASDVTRSSTNSKRPPPSPGCLQPAPVRGQRSLCTNFTKLRQIAVRWSIGHALASQHESHVTFMYTAEQQTNKQTRRAPVKTQPNARKQVDVRKFQSKQWASKKPTDRPKYMYLSTHINVSRCDDYQNAARKRR